MFIDSHFHVSGEKYTKTIEEIYNEALAAGVEKLIAIGTSIADSEETLELIMPYDNIYGSLGVYPHEDQELTLEEIEEDLQTLYKSYRKQIVAVGECGFDITSYDKSRSIEDQKELFKLQIGFALEKDLPLVIHNRNGDEETLRVLEHYKNADLKGVAHCYSSDWETAEKFINLGFYISFSGIVTYPNVSPELLEVVKKIPSDKYLLETDSPFLPPQGHRGEANYPKYVTITAGKIAEIRNIDFAAVEQESSSNAINLFNI